MRCGELVLPVEFLIVDDDEVAQMSFQRAIAKNGLKNTIHTALDGVEGLELLRRGAKRDGLSSPFVILLDINMPRMNGHEFLEELRADPVLRASLVFMLTTSGMPQDIDRAYSLNVAGYLVKDDPVTSLSKTLSLMEAYSRFVVPPNLIPRHDK